MLDFFFLKNVIWWELIYISFKEFKIFKNWGNLRVNIIFRIFECVFECVCGFIIKVIIIKIKSNI